MFMNFFLMFGSWRSLIRIQLEFKYLCWRIKKKLDISFWLKLISSFLFYENTMCTLSDAYYQRSIKHRFHKFKFFRIIHRMIIASCLQAGLEVWNSGAYMNVAEAIAFILYWSSTVDKYLLQSLSLLTSLFGSL